MRLAAWALAGLLAAQVLPASACGATVSIGFSGAVLASAPFYRIPEELQGEIQPGSLVSGWFTYDDTLVEPCPCIGFGKDYPQLRGYGIHANVGGVFVETDRDADPSGLPSNRTLYEIQILNDFLTAPEYEIDSIAILSHGTSGTFPPSVRNTEFELFFQYPDTNGLQTDALLELRNAVAAGTLPPGMGNIGGETSDGSGTYAPYFIPFSIDAVWLVPEPSELALVGGALWMLRLRRLLGSGRRLTPPRKG